MTKLPRVLISAFVTVLSFIFLSTIYNVQAEIADHIVISEVQIVGATSTDEFVELYNPTDQDVDLTGWEIVRKTASVDAEGQTLIMLSGTIPSRGYFLVAHMGYDGSVSPDQTYDTEFNITAGNSLSLRNEETEIDLLGMGDSETFEGATIDEPIDNRSIERKANSTSTNETMAPGGLDEFMGNGEDSDNNFNDFVRHTSPVVSNPQNSSSDVEPQPTDTPTETPTPTDEPTDTPTPTDEPTDTPTPTDEPTDTPTPTEEPTDTPSPTVTTTITPTPPLFEIPVISLVCTPKVKTYTIFGLEFIFTYPSCSIVRL